MGKITLLLFLFLSLNFCIAQTTVWADNFNDEDISDWTLIDADGDSNNWGDLFQIQDGNGTAVTPVSLISRSWQTSALTPDNWAISPAIDLSGASGTITVEWITQVAAASWDEEKYSLHVGASSDQSVLVNSPTSITEILGDDANTGLPVSHSLDISSLAGQSAVHIAIRHWDCTDEDFLSVDDLTVQATTLSISDYDINSFSHNYIKDLQTLNLKTSNNVITNIEIFNMLGQSLLIKRLSSTIEAVDIASLNEGLYLATVTIDERKKSFKFIKN